MKGIKNIITYKIYISGRVQGVGYRHFTRQVADKLGIKGYVRNLPDGRVEVVAQAKPELIEIFKKELKRGPLWADVKNLEEYIIEKSDVEFSDFRVTF